MFKNISIFKNIPFFINSNYLKYLHSSSTSHKIISVTNPEESKSIYHKFLLEGIKDDTKAINCVNYAFSLFVKGRPEYYKISVEYLEKAKNLLDLNDLSENEKTKLLIAIESGLEQCKDPINASYLHYAFEEVDEIDRDIFIDILEEAQKMPHNQYYEMKNDIRFALCEARNKNYSEVRIYDDKNYSKYFDEENKKKQDDFLNS